MPELVASLCTLLVLAPLAFMPGLGEFLFRPMALAVAFAMIAAYLLSRTFVPARCARWLRPHARTSTTATDHEHRSGTSRRAAARSAGASPRWEATDRPRHRAGTSGSSTVRCVTASRSSVGRRRCWWPRSLGLLGPRLRREFFPEVDAGAFEIYVRAAERHADRGDREEDRAGRAVRPRDARRRPAARHLRDRRGRRLVGRLHPQRRADGRRGQGPAHARPRAARRRSTSSGSARASPTTRGSPTWSSPSTPAA